MLLGALALGYAPAWSAELITGQVTDPQDGAVPGAVIRLAPIEVQTKTDDHGFYHFDAVAGSYQLTVNAAGFAPVDVAVKLSPDEAARVNVKLSQVAGQSESVVVRGKALEPSIDLRNAEVFNRTLFARDDQVFQQLDAGIDAGQHEGGGKSLEIRRFGFNLDHGGVNGGLKVMLDDVQHNQGTQGHGQGYLGSLKSLSPELIDNVEIINGPFSAEYGDFSGLGVVHIRQRESMPDEFTVRLEGGNFNNTRGFFAYSPDAARADAYIAYDGSNLDGPFQNPGRYRRDNVNGNYSKSIGQRQKLGFRILYGRNDFYSSGQLPLDLVNSGVLDRFGYIDPTEGGRVKLGTVSSYYTKEFENRDMLKIDGFVGRSLFDLYSNFTFFLNDPVHGDAFQQHDSRLQEGFNTQYKHVHKIRTATALFTGGTNFHDNQINVGLYPRKGRTPTGVTTRADAHVTNVAGYGQESVSLLKGRLILGAGVRYDEFRDNVADLVHPEFGGVQSAGRWQGKGNAAFTPTRRIPLALYANYGRGINSADARAVVQQPDQPRIAVTDFYQLGTSSTIQRLSVSTDVFLIHHSNEQVYIPDDGSFEFKGASRAYGYEAKTSVQLTRRLSLNAGLAKIGNAYFVGGEPRVYVYSAPHFVANAALTLSNWRGWSGSLRMRAVNHYRLDGTDASIAAAGHTVLDLGVAKQVRRGVELNLAIDNLTNRDYYETQNYFESRVTPDADAIARIHATPGYPLSMVAGVTLRFGRKN